MSIHKNKDYLSNLIRSKQSFLCVGLDPDLKKIPDAYLESSQPLFDFCRDVVDATHHLAIAYKINIAFFENHGPDGWIQLEQLINHIPKECFVIADAKRADIGNTSEQYAQYYFDRLKVNALTLHPYMGIDSLQPFLNYSNHWSVVLGLTSNPGSIDFEKLILHNGQMVFETVLEKFSTSGTQDQLMFVIGATQVELMQKVRDVIPNHFLLIPGVGEQGGDLDQTVNLLRNKDEGILINVSRKILFPNGKSSTIVDIRNAAKKYDLEMKKYF